MGTGIVDTGTSSIPGFSSAKRCHRHCTGNRHYSTGPIRGPPLHDRVPGTGTSYEKKWLNCAWLCSFVILRSVPIDKAKKREPLNENAGRLTVGTGNVNSR